MLTSGPLHEAVLSEAALWKEYLATRKQLFQTFTYHDMQVGVQGWHSDETPHNSILFLDQVQVNQQRPDRFSSFGTPFHQSKSEIL